MAFKIEENFATQIVGTAEKPIFHFPVFTNRDNVVERPVCTCTE